MFVRNWKIGADIEVFLQNQVHGEIVSAEGLIKGTKEEPFIYDESSKYNAISLDNVMAEFCINPSVTPAEFYNEIQKALRYINGVIPKELKAAALPAAYLDEKYLQTENALRFGCEPDYNAWTTNVNIAPSPKGNMRTAGGHIHIGYDEPNEFISLDLIKAMDIFVGVPSVLLEPENDRKAMYGRAGAFRFKKYGVEYRTVSNYYLASEELTNWVFDQTQQAIHFVNNSGCNLLDPMEKEQIVTAINKNDKQLAAIIMERYNVKLAA